MLRKTEIFTKVGQGGLQPLNYFAMLQPKRILRQEIFNRGGQFAGAAAQFHQPVQQRTDRDAGLRLSLLHDFGETTQAGEVLFHRAQGCRTSSLHVGIEIGLAQEFLVGLLEILNECLLVRLRIVDQTA